MSETLQDAKIFEIVREARAASEPKATDLKGKPDWAKKVENYAKSSGPSQTHQRSFVCVWRV